MFETVVIWGMIILTALAAVIGVSVLTGYVILYMRRKRAYRVLEATREDFAEVLRGTTDMSRKTLSTWARSLIVALRRHKRKQVNTWLSGSLGELEEMIESLPVHVEGVCKSLKNFRDAIALELHKHEQAIITCAILCRQATCESLDATRSLQERLQALINDERFTAFTLQNQRSCVTMLKNALTASNTALPYDAIACMHRLLVQTRVLTECALESARITANTEFIDMAWMSIDVRLKQLDDAFSFAISWAELMPVASDEWYKYSAEETIVELRKATEHIAGMRDAVRCRDIDGSTRMTTEVFFLRCRLSHEAISSAEDTLRELMTTLSETVFTENYGHIVLH